MAALAGIVNNQLTTAQALTNTTAKAAVTSSSSSTGSSSATIAANDFLTLLVTELKNQDPTANSDPNEYVNQLVAVNSLEQLININSTLTTGLGSTTTGTTKATTESLTANSAAAQSAESNGARSISSALETATSKLAPGNLSVSKANPAAQTVAQALSGLR